jgi:high-affinity nickel-transport protein
VTSTVFGIALGLLVGLRHSFEPDHLTAVSTLIGETHGLRGGALLGAVWGVGHTIALVVVGGILVAVGASLPDRAGAAFELCVAVMLVALGVRAIVGALRETTAPQATAGRARARAWRPLAVGIVHGLAGSGAVTAIVFADLPSTGARLLYMTVFGLGSIAGMALASGAAGATLRIVARSGGARRSLGVATGALSIAIGALWAIPVWSRFV